MKLSRRSLPVLFILGCLALLAGCGSSGGDSSSSTSAEASPAASKTPETGPVAPTKTLSGTVSDPSPAPWSQFARTARRSGGADVVGPQNGTVRWTRKLEGAVVPGPAVGNGGVVYAASNGGVLHAIDLKTGKDRWSFDGGGGYGSDLSTVPAIADDGTILWPGPLDTLFALNTSGDLLWKETLAGQPLSPAVANDGTIVVGDMAGTLEKLQTTGTKAPKKLWSVALGGTSYGSPALATDGTVYSTTEAGLVAVSDGKILWHFAAGSSSEVGAAVAPDGTIVFGSNDSEYGISPDGKEVWRHANGTRTYSSPVVTHDGLAYYGDNRGRVTALDAKSGKLVARVVGLESPPGVWTAVAVDAHHDVYFGTANGHIYGFGAKGQSLFDLEAGGPVDSYPALADDGTLLIGSESGTLYALR
jgi:outer membrane protein assembly factor BamB